MEKCIKDCHEKPNLPKCKKVAQKKMDKKKIELITAILKNKENCIFQQKIICY